MLDGHPVGVEAVRGHAGRFGASGVNWNRGLGDEGAYWWFVGGWGESEEGGRADG